MVLMETLLSVIGGSGANNDMVVDTSGASGGSDELLEPAGTGDFEGLSFLLSSTTSEPFEQNYPPTSDVQTSSTTTNNMPSFNVNLTNVNLDDLVRIGTDINFLTFVLSLVCGILWVLYITFYSSRIIGLVVTKVANRFIKEGYIKIGSISVSVLSGKVMFRDVSYVTEDCSLRIQDGWVIFRWWRAYVPKDISEGKLIVIIIQKI